MTLILFLNLASFHNKAIHPNMEITQEGVNQTGPIKKAKADFGGG